MANYTEIRSIINNAKKVISNVGVNLGKAIAKYVLSTSSLDENDVYNMVKELPQDIQVEALCRAIVELHQKNTAPSYIQNTDKPGRRGLI